MKRREQKWSKVRPGQERTKISCAFWASANGEKLPVLVLIPRKAPIKKFTPPDNVLVVYNGCKKTFDSNTINNCFIQRVLGPHVLPQNQLKSLLFLDSAPFHRTASVKSKLEEFKINFSFYHQE